MNNKLLDQNRAGRATSAPARVADGLLRRAKRLLSLLLLCAVLPLSLQAQNLNISGTVLDGNNDPVAGASVTVKGATIGATTDVNGGYNISAPADATLVFSFLGLSTKEEAVAGRGRIDVVLSESDQSLDEIVVVGYGTQRRESLTGALQTLGNEKIATITTPSVEDMLSGKVPGVFVAPGNGQPGSRGNIIIRGRSSINGTTDPLWVVDGVIVGNASNYTLNPSDVETMTILKDAASTAIYGSQGANGVIVVTTKQAKGGKASVNVSAKFGVSSLDNGKLEVMNGAELYDYFKSFANQEMVAFPRWNEQLRESNYDWWDLATQTGVAQDYNVSVAGGNENVKSYFSMGYYNEEGAVKGYEFTRYSMRYRAEYKPVQWLTVKPSVSGSRRDVDDRQHSITAMYSNLPWDSPYLEDGTPTPNMSSTWVNNTGTNYLYDLQWNKSASVHHSFMGNIDFDIRFTDWLSFSSVNNFTWENYANSDYTDPRSSSGSGVSGRISEDDGKTERRYTNQILRFNKALGKHSISALAAYEFSDYRYKYAKTGGTGFVPGFEVLDVTTTPEAPRGYINTSAIQSLLFNASYAYDGKYMAQVSARRDGASNFGANAKYGNFFSVSGGWIVNKEAFFTAGWVDLLKLRAAYGTVGNRPRSLYPQYDLYSVSGSYDEVFAALIYQIGNKNLTWEKTKTLNIGVDFSFLERFRLNLDYYLKSTDNVLFNVPIPALTGVTSNWQNVGELENRGVEAVVGADIIKNQDWGWSIDVNIGANRNEVKALYQGLEQVVSGASNIAGGIERILKPGYSSDTWYTYEWAGVNSETGAPQWYTTAEDGSRVITEDYAKADRVMCGSYTPDFYGGFSTLLRWKQLDLNAVFGYSVGGTIFNYARMEYDSDGTYNTDRNQIKLIDGWSRWTKPGDNATHPLPSFNNSSKSSNTSSRYLEDGSYLKLRSLSVGYTLPLKKWKIQSLRVSFTAENLLTFTKYSGVDPEIPVVDLSRSVDTDMPVNPNRSYEVSGVSNASNYPITRKYIFGINLNF
ncbi:MAG: TonB-dependent receptor [Prevotellaceae bacterium]|jgi:TonB-linked SusC/RagA family outer membrane protein|nr:TonB-dependent receptor [Prevotellaceae bacterium]